MKHYVRIYSHIDNGILRELGPFNHEWQARVSEQQANLLIDEDAYVLVEQDWEN